MCYVVSCIEEDAEEFAYQIYVTDGLLCLSENLKAGGRILGKRFYECLHPVADPYEGMTGQQIADDIIKRHGLKTQEEEE